jgi:hypothetical protein
MSGAFERLPEEVLLPWLPGLILTLRPHADSVLPNLLKEASACVPATLGDLRRWQPPWRTTPATPRLAAQAAPALTPAEASVRLLLVFAPACANALAALLGLEPVWQAALPPAVATTSPAEAGAGDLLRQHPASLRALAELLP